MDIVDSVSHVWILLFDKLRAGFDRLRIDGENAVTGMGLVLSVLCVGWNWVMKLIRENHSGIQRSSE